MKDKEHQRFQYYSYCYNIIKKIKPQFLFKGDDYKISQVVGAKEIERWGGKVVLIKCIKGKSTSKIIERIKNGT